MPPTGSRGARKPGSRQPNNNNNMSRASPSLPAHTHRIMETFLWNNKKPTKGHDQKKQEERQSLILKGLQRPTSHPRQEEEARVFPMQQYPSKDAQKRKFIRKSGLSPINNYIAKQPPVQRSAGAQPTADEIQPLIEPIHHQPIARSIDTSASNRMNWNTMNKQQNHSTTINHRSHNIQQPISTSNTTQQFSSPVHDEDEDIVCCDCFDGGGQCHEGTKNLCTIALWALIVFAIMNRFFVHMAMHLHHKPESVNVKVVDDVIGSVSESGSVLGQFDMQDITNTSVLNTGEGGGGLR